MEKRDSSVMDNTYKQTLIELMGCWAELERLREQLRLLQADYTDMKNKADKGANKGI